MTEFNYKEIIYLDSIELNSILAQLDQGVIDSKQTNSSSGSDKVKGTKQAASAGVNFGAKIGIDSELTATESQNEAVSESINIYFKDYQLNRLLQKAETNSLFSETTEEGKLIKITGTFDIFTPELLKNIDVDTLIDVMRFTNKEMTRDDLRENKKNFKNIVSFGSMMENFLPDSTVIKINNSVSLLENSNLRSKIGQLTTFFGTSRKITMVGIVDSIVNNGQREMDALGAKLEESIKTIGYFNVAFQDTMLEAMNLTEKGDMVVKPIALYFE